MKQAVWCLVLAALCFAPALAQNEASTAISSSTDGWAGGSAFAAGGKSEKKPEVQMAPFSRLAVGAGISLDGISGRVATNMTRRTNLRVSGGAFRYSISDITSNGFTAGGNLSLGAVGVGVDIFPFPLHGLRVTPGVMFYNQNTFNANATVNGGETFTLNGVTYTSSPSDPINASGNLNLFAHNASFTLSAGWGNMIPRRGGHWSFPVEIGAAFVGDPKIKISLKGTACDAQGQNCKNASTDSSIQQNLNAQINKYIKDLDPLKTWPVVSFGISYCFKVR